MSNTDKFWTMLAISLLLIMGAGHQIIIKGFYAGTALGICEKELPRNQSCRITAEPIPMEKNDE